MPPSSPINVVVLGLPGSGKSSLLGALWQVAQSQAPVLGGTLKDEQGGLAKLHESLYASQRSNVAGEETTNYTLRFEAAADSKSAPVNATLIDVSGRTTQELLGEKDGLARGRGPLAQALAKADAVVVLLDPTTGGAQLEKDFNQVCTFLSELESWRARRYDVAGLPVYVVLTKVDQFAKQTDPGAAWVQRIEDGKRKIDKKLRDQLARRPGRDRLAFGKLDVHLWATSVKRPQLADKPARHQEPWGVAELFRQCFRSAHEFEVREEQSHGMLIRVVMGFVGLIAVMAAGAGLFLVTRPSAERVHLESEIHEVVPGPRAPAVMRLKEPEDRRKKIEMLKKNPAYSSLPHALHEDVASAEEEIDAYLRLQQKFKELVPDPRALQDDSYLVRMEKGLDAFAQEPDFVDYQDRWKDTPLIRREQQYRKGIKLLREAVQGEVDWIRNQIEVGRKLETQDAQIIAGTVPREERAAWFAAVDEFLARGPRHKDGEPLAGAPFFTYGTVSRFAPVAQARLEWKETKESLENQRRRAQRTRK